jgi:hypothetical protein
MADNFLHRPRVLEPKGGYQGGPVPPNFGPPARTPSGIGIPGQPKRKKRAK